MTTTTQTIESRVLQVLGPVTFTYNTPGFRTGLTLGALPAGAQVLGSIITVSQGFNQTSTNVITVGTNAQYDNFHSLSSGNTVGNYFVTNTPSGGAYITADAEVKTVFAGTGPSGPTTGRATVSLLFIGPQRS